MDRSNRFVLPVTLHSVGRRGGKRKKRLRIIVTLSSICMIQTLGTQNNKETLAFFFFIPIMSQSLC